jgi:hypothetical protein
LKDTDYQNQRDFWVQAAHALRNEYSAIAALAPELLRCYVDLKVLAKQKKEFNRKIWKLDHPLSLFKRSTEVAIVVSLIVGAAIGGIMYGLLKAPTTRVSPAWEPPSIFNLPPANKNKKPEDILKQLGLDPKLLNKKVDDGPKNKDEKVGNEGNPTAQKNNPIRIHRLFRCARFAWKSSSSGRG